MQVTLYMDHRGKVDSDGLDGLRQVVRRACPDCTGSEQSRNVSQILTMAHGKRGLHAFRCNVGATGDQLVFVYGAPPCVSMESVARAVHAA